MANGTDNLRRKRHSNHQPKRRMDGPHTEAFKRRRRWSQEDDQILRETFLIASPKDMARKLGRTKSAVVQRAVKVHRLLRRRSRPRGARWTPKALAFLEANYGVIPAKEIGETLHRTVPAIHSRAYLLGLTKQILRGPNRLWTVEDEQYVLANYGKLPTELLAREVNRTPVAVSNRALNPRWGVAVRRRSRRGWAPAEDTLLRSAYRKVPTSSLRQILGRSTASIHGRAHKTGLTQRMKWVHPRAWTRAEDEVLRNTYGSVRPREIGAKLARTRGSVYHRAQRLGLLSQIGSPEFLRRQSLPLTARPFKSLTDPMEIGYVAGILDGEGSVIGPPKFAVQVSMTTKEVIEHLTNLCGGSMTGPYEQRSGKSENCKPQYHWTISSSENTYRLLRTLLPHLIVKKQKAEQVIGALEKKWSA